MRGISSLKKFENIIHELGIRCIKSMEAKVTSGRMQSGGSLSSLKQ